MYFCTTFQSTTTMTSILSYIQQAHKVAIFTHQSPDGDAMGSSLAMYHYIISLGKEAQVIVPNAFPDFLAWMPGADSVLLYDTHQAQADAYLDAADLVICTDFNAPSRIGALGDKMLSLTCPKVMIDHHLHPSNFADFIVSVPEASSTCELVCELLSTLNSHRPMPLHRTHDRYGQFLLQFQSPTNLPHDCLPH